MKLRVSWRVYDIKTFSPLLVSDLTLSKAEKGLLCTLWDFEISLSLSFT